MTFNNRTGTAWLLFVTASFTPIALAQSGSAQHDIVSNTLTGGVDTLTAPSDRRAHVQGSVGLSTSDYFRGSYRNVEEDLDQIAFTTGISAAFELLRDNIGPLSGLTMSLGTANNFASDEDRPALDENGHWYKSNWYAGLAGRLGDNWLGSLTYTAYGVPASNDDPTHEIAVATQYAGDDPLGHLGPQLKLAAPFAAETDAAADGVFASIGLTPTTQLGQQGQNSVSLSFPMEVGVGFNDYYGPDNGTPGYASIGVSASKPLAFVPASYGNWSVTGAIDVLARNSELRDTEPGFADDTVIPSTSVSLSVTY